MPSDLTVLPKIVETRDVYTCLQALEELSAAVYKTGEEGFEAVLAEKISRDVAQAVTESLQKSGAGDDLQKRKEVIGAMQTELKNIPVLDLQAAVGLPAKSLVRIHDWARTNLTDPVVVEVKIDPEIMGGVKITFGGRYADKSVQSRWPEIWAEAAGREEVRGEN